MMALVRVLTWNVHGALGLDGLRDFSRVVEHVVALDPDIVALQEVEGRNRGGRSPPMAILRDRIGHHGVNADSITTDDGEYGQVLLSRWPLTNIRILDISVARREPRRAIAATAATPIGQVRFISTHLGLRFGERGKQAAALCAAAGDEKTAVLMGDFNDWFRYRSVQAALERDFPVCTRLGTYPSRAPLFALDRIYCRPAAILARAWTVKSAPMLSDHLPLMAELAAPEVT
jgi:endonuclease/exonuclease/phosphatase family metal-dependent hydrolase